jgi:hypothetical protein
MPLLLDALEHAQGPDYKKLRQKAMECAGLIGVFHSSCSCNSVIDIHHHSAIAVGQDTFRADAPRFVEALMQIQSQFLSDTSSI